MLVDKGSNMNIMCHDVFVKLKLSEYKLRTVRTPLAGFTSNMIETEDSITLPIESGAELTIKRVTMKFVVIKLTCACKIIIG